MVKLKSTSCSIKAGSSVDNMHILYTLAISSICDGHAKIGHVGT